MAQQYAQPAAPPAAAAGGAGDGAAAAAGDASGEPQFDFESTFERLADRPCRVERIMVEGLHRTKGAVVQRVLMKVKGAATLEEVRDAALEAYEELMGLDIFDAVDVVITEGLNKAGDTCCLRVAFIEKNIMRLHAGTYVQGTEGSVETSLNLTSPFGYAEQISIGAEYGSQATNVYTLALSQPRPRGLPAIADVRLHQLFHSFGPWSSYSELLRGGVATLTSEDARHAVSYELGWRRLSDPGRTASRAVLAQLGDKLLSAVKYVARGDTFDNPAFPTTGWGYRLETQVAGLGSGSDASLLRFVRQHVQGKVAFPVAGTSAAVTLSGEAGVLLPWGARGLAVGGVTPISDRFFLGGLGASPLRGFAQKGIGPSEPRRPVGESGSDGDTPRPAAPRRDALGGDLVCSFMAALNFQLPFEAARNAGMHGHLFLNGGNLVGLGGGGGGGRGLGDAWRDFNTTFRWSVGAGIVWPTIVGKLELNVCKVLARQAHDQPRVGVQFGFVPPSW